MNCTRPEHEVRTLLPERRRYGSSEWVPDRRGWIVASKVDGWMGDRGVDIGLLLLRLGFGLGFVYFHGWAKLVAGPERWGELGAAVEHVGIGVGHTYVGFLAAFAESIGGLLIAAGFLFRPAALLVTATMFIAWVMHVSTGRGTPAHAFKNMWVALGLALIGPGRYSVDHWLASRRRAPEIELEREDGR